MKQRADEHRPRTNSGPWVRARFRVVHVSAPLAAYLSLSLLVGCADRLDLSDDVARPGACAVVFFVDGMDHARFEALLRTGEVPNLERCFVDGGVRVEHAVDCLPAITYLNTASLLTGCLPDRHGVYGNHWFDRSTLGYRDYRSGSTFRRVNDDLLQPTIYERLSGELTVNVLCHTRRGVTETIDHAVSNGIDWGLGLYESVDARSGRSLHRVARIARRHRRWPVLTLFYFPGVDEIGHRAGSDSPRYRSALCNVDQQVGHVVDSIESAAPAKRVYFVLVSDHGHVATPPARRTNLMQWLREHRGIRISERPPGGSSRAARARRLARFDAVAIRGAHRRVAIFLRGDAGWEEPATVLQVRDFVHGGAGAPPLYGAPGVNLVCYRGPNGEVFVESSAGAAVVESRRRSGETVYRLRSPAREGGRAADNADILGYDSWPGLAAFVNAGWHRARSWLQATAASRYPDFVPQIARYFDSPRAGDVLVLADQDYSFDQAEAGGHGSALARDMHIPLYFRGPDLSPGASVPCGRIVDVAATILDLIGRPLDENAAAPIDGTSLAPALRDAVPPGAAR